MQRLPGKELLRGHQIFGFSCTSLFSKPGMERNAPRIRENRKGRQAWQSKPQCEAGQMSTKPPEQVTLWVGCHLVCPEGLYPATGGSMR